MIKYRRDLYKLLPELATTVEIGVAEGLFSRDILNWNLGHHYMVDAWQQLDQTGDGGYEQEWHTGNYEKACKLANEFNSRATILRGRSHIVAKEIPDNSVDMAYIDGDHSYEGVCRDIRAYLPKLKTGGIMAFHDYEMAHYGVKQAVKEFFSTVYLLPEDRLEDAGAYIIKP